MVTSWFLVSVFLKHLLVFETLLGLGKSYRFIRLDMNYDMRLY